jgi:ERF superfamily
MSETKLKLVEKLANAKKEIKDTKVVKEGKNTFSNYSYFTPTQIEFLVQKACFDNRILTKFDLIRDALGVYGTLTIFDLDSEETLVFNMASAIPEIKATNIAQQLGGCVTYTERYLKMSVFGITDTNLDFDSKDNREVSKKEVAQVEVTELDWINLEAIFESKSDKIDADKYDAVKKSVFGRNPKYYNYTLSTLNKL